MSPLLSHAILRTQTDERLIELARERHERAFEALVERYRKPLHRHVGKLLPEARAEDAVQQAFINAWTALQRGVEVREPRPWLYRIAQNAALNALRVHGYEYDELQESLRSHAAGPEDDHERRWVMRRTLAGLAALPASQREALLRTAVEGRSQEQVAAELGLSEGAVRGLVYRARTALRAAATALTPPRCSAGRWPSRRAADRRAPPSGSPRSPRAADGERRRDAGQGRRGRGGHGRTGGRHGGRPRGGGRRRSRRPGGGEGRRGVLARPRRRGPGRRTRPGWRRRPRRRPGRARPRRGSGPRPWEGSRPRKGRQPRATRQGRKHQARRRQRRERRRRPRHWRQLGLRLGRGPLGGRRDRRPPRHQRFGVGLVRKRVARRPFGERIRRVGAGGGFGLQRRRLGLLGPRRRRLGGPRRLG